MELRHIIRKVAAKKNLSSLNIMSVCLRVLKKHYNDENMGDGYIRHHILFLRDVPRGILLQLYRDKPALLKALNTELKSNGYAGEIKDIITK